MYSLHFVQISHVLFALVLEKQKPPSKIIINNNKQNLSGKKTILVFSKANVHTQWNEAKKKKKNTKTNQIIIRICFVVTILIYISCMCTFFSEMYFCVVIQNNVYLFLWMDVVRVCVCVNLFFLSAYCFLLLLHFFFIHTLRVRLFVCCSISSFLIVYSDVF